MGVVLWKDFQGGRFITRGVLFWLCTFPVMVVIYVSLGHSCVSVCLQMPGRTWEGLSEGRTWLTTDQAAIDAKTKGISYCEYLYGGDGTVIPTPSMIGASVPEYYIFSSHMMALSIFLGLGYVEAHSTLQLYTPRASIIAIHSEQLMRCLAGVSVVGLCFTGLFSVGDLPSYHNYAAGTFFFAQTVHTWWSWSVQYYNYASRLPQNDRWYDLVMQLRSADAHNKVKVAVSFGYAAFLALSGYCILYVDTFRILRSVGPLLEYCLIFLQDCALLTFGQDLHNAWLASERPGRSSNEAEKVVSHSNGNRKFLFTMQIFLGGICLSLLALLIALFAIFANY